MPTLDPAAVFGNLPANQRASLLENQGETLGEPITFFGTIGDAFLQENAAVNIATALFTPPRRTRIVEGYNPFVDDAEITLADADFVDEYRRSTSPEETRAISVEIGVELNRRRRLAQAGGLGILASIAAGILSPENLYPIGFIARPIRIAKTLRSLSRGQQVIRLAGAGAGRSSINASLAGLVQEAIAQETLGLAQRTRSTEEKVYNVIGATVLSGALGGVFGAIGETRRGLQELIGEEIKEGLTGTRVRHLVDSEDFRRLPGDEQRLKLIDVLAKDNPAVARLLAQPKTWLGRFWRKGFRWNPQLRLSTSESQTARILVKRLTDNPMLRIEDLKLGDDIGTSVEAAIILTYARSADSILRIRDVYVKAHAQGMPLREAEYREQVTKAMRNEDKAIEGVVDKGTADAINEGAGIARKVFDKIADDAEAVGLLAKRELRGTAKSYVTRVWDREKVRQNREKLRGILVEHFSNDHNLRSDPGKLADDAIDSILGLRTGSDYIPDPHLVGEAGPFRERLILVRDEAVQDFLENDIVEVMNRFVNEVAPQVELAKAFRTGSGAIDALPRRLELAVRQAEKDGDTGPLLDILEDTASLRAAAALAGGLTEDGLAKQARIEDLVRKLPELRTEHRELVKRHRTQRTRVDQYDEARATRESIEEEIQGSGFDQARSTVRDPFLDELAERRAGPERRTRDRAAAALRKAEKAETSARNRRVLAERQAGRENQALADLRRRGNKEIPRETRETFDDELDEFNEGLEEVQPDAQVSPEEAWNRVMDAALDRQAVAPVGFEATVVQLRTALSRGRLRTLATQARAGRAQGLAEAKLTVSRARAEITKTKARLEETQRAMREKALELLKDGTTRRQFFQVWRRWVEDKPETLFPSTRVALERFSRAPQGQRFRELQADYVRATGRVEAQRPSVQRARRRAAQLAEERDAAGAALEEGQGALEGLRKEAQKLDDGVAIKIAPEETDVKDLARIAGTAIDNARRIDAIRAVRLDNMVAKIHADFRKQIAKRPKEGKKLEAERDNEILDVQVIRDRLLNRAGLERGDPHHWAFRAERTFRRVNFMRFMGGVMLSSIPDIAMPIFVNGLRPTIRAWKQMLRQPLKELQNQLKLKPTKSLEGLAAREELVRLAVALELADNARVKAFGDIGDMVASGGAIEKGIDRLSNTFANATLINRWNAFHKGIATLSTMNRALDDIDKLVTKGVLSKSGRKNLAAAGINARMAERIHKQAKKWGQTDGGQRLPRTQLWDDLEAKKVFQDAITADVRRTIITPSAGDLPRWMSMPLVRLMGQFRSFAMSSTLKILGSGLQRLDASVAQGAVFMTMLGGAAWALKEIVRGRDPTLASEGTWVQNSIDRSGALGIVMDINGILERVTFGRWGLGALTGSGVSTRFQARNVVDSFLGPTAGTAVDLVSSAMSLFGEGGTTQVDVSTMRRLVPANQLFYIRWVFDRMEGGAAEVFNLPANRREARKRAQATR